MSEKYQPFLHVIESDYMDGKRAEITSKLYLTLLFVKCTCIIINTKLEMEVLLYKLPNILTETATLKSKQLFYEHCPTQ